MKLEQAIKIIEHMLPGGDTLPDAWVTVRTIARHNHQLLSECRQALDILMSQLIVRDHTYFPSKSGLPWSVIKQLHEVLDK